MNAILKYLATVIGLSFAIWVMTLGSYNLYKNHQDQPELIFAPTQAQSPKPNRPSKVADTLYQKTTDIVILKSN